MEGMGDKMSETKLKPCPFCGGEAKIIGAIGAVFCARCTECGAETQSELSEQQAAELWNRRAGERDERD